MTIAGIILAGGQGRRLGGCDKALLDLGGRPLWAWAQARLAPQVAALALSANGDRARFAGFDGPILPDDPGVGDEPDGAGPLAGILAGLDWAAGAGADRLASVAVDTPFLPPDLVARLAAAAPTGAPVVLAARGGRVHPTCGLWAVDLRADLRRALAGGTRKLGHWARMQGAVQVRFDDGAFDPFFNINTDADLTQARDLAGTA